MGRSVPYQQSLFPVFAPNSLYDMIAQWSGYNPSVPDLAGWLDDLGLAWEGQTYQPSVPEERELLAEQQRIWQGVPSQAVSRLKQDEIKEIEKRFRASPGARSRLSSLEVQKRIWEEYKHAYGMVMLIDAERMPADALAFYRFFHAAPHAEWGIYLLVDRLLDYCTRLSHAFQEHLQSFDEATLMGCILFEVFHHEFFHHMVECTATVMEIILAATGRRESIYLDYRRHCYESRLGRHPHKPLEEALANAYAYNAFTFISRVDPSYNAVLGTLYQEVLKKCWPTEPEGYRHAAAYIKGSYVEGAAQLLAMMLASSQADARPLLLLASRVMPMGHTAFLQKADVPCYLVGEDASLKRFMELVPAPNETCVKLYWPGDTSKIDAYIKQRKKEEQDAKKAAKSTRASGTQPPRSG